MNHYVAVLVPLASGRWHAYFPDLPDCEAEASAIDLAAMHAARALAQYAETLNGKSWTAPPPRELADIKSDEIWSAAHAIDWRNSVVTMIALRVGVSQVLTRPIPGFTRVEKGPRSIVERPPKA